MHLVLSVDIWMSLFLVVRCKTLPNTLRNHNQKDSKIAGNSFHLNENHYNSNTTLNHLTFYVIWKCIWHLWVSGKHVNSQLTLSSPDFHSILPGIDFFFLWHISHEISYNPPVVYTTSILPLPGQRTYHPIIFFLFPSRVIFFFTNDIKEWEFRNNSIAACLKTVVPSVSKPQRQATAVDLFHNLADCNHLIYLAWSFVSTLLWPILWIILQEDSFPWVSVFHDITLWIPGAQLNVCNSGHS